MVGAGGYAAVAIGQKYIVLFAATCRYACKALAIFETFYRVDAQHCFAQCGVQLIKFGLAQAYGTPFYHTADNAANGVALGFHLRDELFHLQCLLWVGTSHSVALCERQVVWVIIALEGNVSHLRCICLHTDTQLLKHHLCQRSTHTACYGDTCRCASATAMIAHAILCVIGKVGMRGSEQVA